MDVLGLTVELDEIGAEVRAHRPEDLLQPIEVATTKDRMTVLGDEHKCTCRTHTQCLPARLSRWDVTTPTYTCARAAQHIGRSGRLYPSQQQAARLTSWAHTRRAIYNLGIEHRECAWARHRVRNIRVSDAEQCRELADLRMQLDWVAEPPSHVLQQAQRDVDRACAKWWRGTARRPTYEKRGQLRFRLSADDIRVRHRDPKWSKVHLPKLGWVRFRRSRAIPGTLKAATFRCVGGT